MSDFKYDTREDTDLLFADSPEEAVNDWFDMLWVGDDVPKTITVHRFKKLEPISIGRIKDFLDDVFERIDEEYGWADSEHCVTMTEEEVDDIARLIQQKTNVRQYEHDGEEEVEVLPCLDSDDEKLISSERKIVE